MIQWDPSVISTLALVASHISQARQLFEASGLLPEKLMPDCTHVFINQLAYCVSGACCQGHAKRRHILMTFYHRKQVMDIYISWGEAGKISELATA